MRFPTVDANRNPRRRRKRTPRLNEAARFRRSTKWRTARARKLKANPLCELCEAAGRTVLVDCGLYQERAFQERNWAPRPVDAASLHSVVLTHAHLDHCGLLPRLVAEGFSGPIYCTPPTADLARLILEDSARIQKEDVAYKKRRHKREGRVSEHPYDREGGCGPTRCFR